MAATLAWEKFKLTSHSFCFALLPTGFQLVQSTFFVALFISHQGNDIRSLPATTMFLNTDVTRMSQFPPKKKAFLHELYIICCQHCRNFSDCFMHPYITISGGKKYMLRNSPMDSLFVHQFFSNLFPSHDSF